MRQWPVAQIDGNGPSQKKKKKSEGERRWSPGRLRILSAILDASSMFKTNAGREVKGARRKKLKGRWIFLSVRGSPRPCTKPLHGPSTLRPEEAKDSSSTSASCSKNRTMVEAVLKPKKKEQYLLTAQIIVTE